MDAMKTGVLIAHTVKPQRETIVEEAVLILKLYWS